MEDIFTKMLEGMPEMLNTTHLIELGIFTNKDAAYLARKAGATPPFIQMRKKVLYPKALFIEWMQKNLKTIGVWSKD